MFRPFDVFGNNAEPPGNVMVNVPFGATESGNTNPTVMSIDCVTGLPFTIAVQTTAGNTCEIV